jgi:hypothetical protein
MDDELTQKMMYIVYANMMAFTILADIMYLSSAKKHMERATWLGLFINPILLYESIRCVYQMKQKGIRAPSSLNFTIYCSILATLSLAYPLLFMLVLNI